VRGEGAPPSVFAARRGRVAFRGRAHPASGGWAHPNGIRRGVGRGMSEVTAKTYVHVRCVYVGSVLLILSGACACVCVCVGLCHWRAHARGGDIGYGAGRSALCIARALTRWTRTSAWVRASCASRAFSCSASRWSWEEENRRWRRGVSQGRVGTVAVQDRGGSLRVWKGEEAGGVPAVWQPPQCASRISREGFGMLFVGPSKGSG
jgi:hypothetical protein